MYLSPAADPGSFRATPFLSPHTVDRFLLFGRNLLEQSSGEPIGGYDSDAFDWRSGANNSLAPNESDEVALEFLHKHAGDLRRAQFHLTTQVSGGAGERPHVRYVQMNGFIHHDSSMAIVMSLVVLALSRDRGVVWESQRAS